MTTRSPSGGTRAADELAVLLRPLGRAVSSRWPEIVAGFAVLVTVLAVLAVGGAALDDRAIAANTGRADAEVLDGSSFARTLVRFTLDNGEAVIPQKGVFYPRGLAAGTVVPVEYDTTDPELVRVAGMSALSASGPLAIGVLVMWVLLAPLAVWLRRRRAAATDRGRTA